MNLRYDLSFIIEGNYIVGGRPAGRFQSEALGRAAYDAAVASLRDTLAARGAGAGVFVSVWNFDGEPVPCGRTFSLAELDDTLVALKVARG